MAKVTKEMGIMEIVQQHPEAVAVFQKYGMGCIGCAAAHFENLEAGARVVGIGRDLCGKSDMAEITSSAERLLKSVK